MMGIGPDARRFGTERGSGTRARYVCTIWHRYDQTCAVFKNERLKEWNGRRQLRSEKQGWWEPGSFVEQR